MKTKVELLAEIEKLKKQVEEYCEYASDYPKYMLAYNHQKSEQYIVRFVSKTYGEVVAVSDNASYMVGCSSEEWIEHTNTEYWKETTNPNELCDKDVVECWDDNYIALRCIKFYDAKNSRTYDTYDGERNGAGYENYRKLMPWEEPEWCEEARKTLED